MSAKDPGVEPETNDDGKWKEILSYWRRFPANFFDDEMQKDVVLVLQGISSTNAE
jgi:hypothetical protein